MSKQFNMIQIKITGFKNLTVELENQKEVLSFLNNLKKEKHAYLKKSKHLPSIHPLKVEIAEFDADMSDFILENFPLILRPTVKLI